MYQPVAAKDSALVSVLTENPKQDSLSAVQFRNDLTRDFNVKLLDTKTLDIAVVGATDANGCSDSHKSGQFDFPNPLGFFGWIRPASLM